MIKKFNLFLLLSLFIICCNLTINAATIGDTLTDAEDGWKRFDDSEVIFLNPDGNWIFGKALGNSYYNTTQTYVENNGSIKFSFYGTKIRIIARTSNTRSTTNTVTIDGETTTYSAYTPDIRFQQLVFEKQGLPKGHHVIELSMKNTGQWLTIDAIDLDEDGYFNDSIGVLDFESDTTTVQVLDIVDLDLVIDNMNDISAEDIYITYDSTKLEYMNSNEVPGIKLVKKVNEPDKLRLIMASKGEENIIHTKQTLINLNFKALSPGETVINISNARVTDGITLERDLTPEECGEITIIIEETDLDVNNDEKFSLLDLGIDARHLGKDPNAAELAVYNTDIVRDGAIDDTDLIRIAQLMMTDPTYKPNNY